MLTYLTTPFSLWHNWFNIIILTFNENTKPDFLYVTWHLIQLWTVKYCQPVCVWSWVFLWTWILHLARKMQDSFFLPCQFGVYISICHTAFSHAHPLCSSFIYVFICQGQPLILSEACICTQWLESHLSGQPAQAPSFFHGLVWQWVQSLFCYHLEWVTYYTRNKTFMYIWMYQSTGKGRIIPFLMLQMFFFV